MVKVRSSDAAQIVLDYMIRLTGISKKWEYGFRLYLTRYVETPVVLVEIEWLSREGHPVPEEKVGPGLYQWIKDIAATYLASHSSFLDKDTPIFAYSPGEAEEGLFQYPYTDWLEITAERYAFGTIPTRHLFIACEIDRKTNFLSFSRSAAKAIYSALNAVPETRTAKLMAVQSLRHDWHRANEIKETVEALG